MDWTSIISVGLSITGALGSVAVAIARTGAQAATKDEQIKQLIAAIETEKRERREAIEEEKRERRQAIADMTELMRDGLNEEKAQWQEFSYQIGTIQGALGISRKK